MRKDLGDLLSGDFCLWLLFLLFRFLYVSKTHKSCFGHYWTNLCLIPVCPSLTHSWISLLASLFSQTQAKGISVRDAPPAFMIPLSTHLIVVFGQSDLISISFQVFLRPTVGWRFALKVEKTSI